MERRARRVSRIAGRRQHPDVQPAGDDDATQRAQVPEQVAIPLEIIGFPGDLLDQLARPVWILSVPRGGRFVNRSRARSADDWYAEKSMNGFGTTRIRRNAESVTALICSPVTAERTSNAYSVVGVKPT